VGWRRFGGGHEGHGAALRFCFSGSTVAGSQNDDTLGAAVARGIPRRVMMVRLGYVGCGIQLDPEGC
jgi:hypothetical protein